MQRREAKKRAEELSALSDGGELWFEREVSPGEWQAVKVVIPGMKPTGPTHTTTEVKPKPTPAEDPRKGALRNVPGFGGGGQ